MVSPRCVAQAEYRRVVERVRVVDDRGDAEHEAEVADAVDQERLQVREDRRRRVYQKPISR